METLTPTQVAMLDITNLKKELGLMHEAANNDYFDTSFVSASHLNTKENRRLNKLAILAWEVYHAEHIEWG